MNHLFLVKEKSVLEYMMMRKKKIAKTRHFDCLQNAKQSSLNIQKDLFRKDEHFQVKAKKSTHHFQAQKSKVNARETLETVETFINDDFFIKADEAFSEYQSGKAIEFTGHVCITILEKGAPIGFGLADKFLYDPHTKKASLLSEKEPVLLWKREMMLSAPQIDIDKTREIKGVGTVRFTFNEEELKKLNENFRSEKPR